MATQADTLRTPLPLKSGSLSWLWQAVSGLALVALGGLHMTANHFMVAGGLQNFEQVQTYLSQPILLVLEALFLVMVVLHAMLGVRAIVFDLGLSAQAERRVTLALTVVGVLSAGYGLWLTWVVMNA